jgi:hypothetical protein
VLHSEPGTPLARQHLDLCYAYEELWLPSSLLDPTIDEAEDWRRVRTGRDLAAWFRDLDAIVIDPTQSAHFIDAHDTIWWRLPGDLWRREQFGIAATQALLAVFGLRPGSLLTFVGGETDLGPTLLRLHDIRHRFREIVRGVARFDLVEADHDSVYAVAYVEPTRACVVLVNLSNEPVETFVRTGLTNKGDIDRRADWWNDGTEIAVAETEPLSIHAAFEPFQARVISIASCSQR